MKRFNYIVVVLLALFLAGCGAKTTGKDITTQNTFEFGDVYAPVTISPNLSTQSGDTEQDVTAPTEITTDAILTPSAQLDKAAKGLADAKILAKANELNAAKIGEQLEDAEEALEEVESDLEKGVYETRFHHTMTSPASAGRNDKGKSLVLCPGQVMAFDKCTSGDVTIPLKDGLDEGRVTYWAEIDNPPAGDIVCVKDGKSYRYKADKTMLYGKCE